MARVLPSYRDSQGSVLMQTTPLGRTGANVSAMCLGTMLFGSRVDDRNTPLEESLTAFGRLVQAGKVRYLGASNHLAWRLAQAHAICEPRNLPAYGCIQQRYTYLHPVPGTNCAPQVLANEDLLDYCQATGLTLLAYSPLLGGAYDRPERMAAHVARVRALLKSPVIDEATRRSIAARITR